jgi:hypothetical protein
MQKTYLFVGIMILWATSFSQPMIDKNHMPVPGYAAYLSTPDTLAGIDPVPTDSNFNWDFQSFTPVSQRRDSFISVNALPFAVRFLAPGGTDAVLLQATPDSLGEITLGDAYSFFGTEDTAHLGLGFAGTVGGFPLGLINNPPDVIYRFPLTYGQRDTSYSEAELNIPNFVYVKREQTRITHVDGWGNLTTPYGSFEVMRVKSSISGSDTISFDSLNIRIPNPGQTEYKWLGTEERVPLLQINTLNADSIGEFVSSIVYVDSMRSFEPPLSLDASRLAEPLRMYPNPTQQKTTIEVSDFGEFTIELYDLKGKLLQKTDFRGPELELNLTQYSKGIYPVKVVGKDRVFRGKLVIR